MAPLHAHRLEQLAEELTRRLSIPFKAAGNGTITFRDRLRVTDWAVPLMFDGHARREQDALIPVGFVGHALWPALKVSRSRAGDRPWWSCTLKEPVARAIVESLQDEDEHPLDDGVWVVGRDVLLEEVSAPSTPAHRRVA
jgi:hypothetical protein